MGGEDTIPTAPTGSPSSPSLTLRNPSVADAAAMWRLAHGSLDVNSPYSYLMLCEYFSSTCSVAEIDGRVAAFVSGFRVPADPDTVFIWQIAVGERARRRGIGASLLDDVIARQRPAARFLEATVTPDNAASAHLFRSFARRRGAACHEEPLFDRDSFPDGGHEPEIRYRIGPF